MEPEQVQATVVNSTDETLDFFAFVEVMGHSKIAGRLTTRKLGVAVMLQVDVLGPNGSGPAYSKLFSPASIFSITPVDEAYCRKWSEQAARYDVTPVPYIQPTKQLAASSSYDDDPEENQEYDMDDRS